MQHVTELLSEMGGGHGPMLYGARPGGSMTLLFGPPFPDSPQRQLPLDVVRVQAERVAGLIDVQGEELFRRALSIGAPVARYSRLTRLVRDEGVSLRWAVRGEPARTLRPQAAEQQYALLTATPRLREREQTANGTLYRVIAESVRENERGTVGIHLFDWSARPPQHRGERIIVSYEDPNVEAQIKAGLIGEPVVARLLLREPVPGTGVVLETPPPVLRDIQLGPREESRLGLGRLDDEQPGPATNG